MQRMRGLLAAASIVAGGALRQQARDEGHACAANDELAYVHIVKKACLMPGKMKSSREEFFQYMQEGCWAMKLYNTDDTISSALYQNEADGRCLLAFSGYHGHITGYLKAAGDLTNPMSNWNVCGNQIHAPFVKIMRRHTSLSNWTEIANFLGANTTCNGPVTVAAESAGGSMAEILAACANSGSLAEIQNKSFPTFQVDALYTFGAPASSKTPISNPLHPKGCFRGKRIFNRGDQTATYEGIAGMKHSRMDSIEIFPRKDGPRFKVTPCLSTVSDPTSNKHAKPGPALVTHVKWKPREVPDSSQHEIFTYEWTLSFLNRAGYGEFLTNDLIDPGSSVYVSALKTRGPVRVNVTAEEG